MAGHGSEQQGRRGADQFEILHARSLGPLVKARAFGMTSWSGGLIRSSEAEEPADQSRRGTRKVGARLGSARNTSREIPRLAGESAGLRDDVLGPEAQFVPQKKASDIASTDS